MEQKKESFESRLLALENEALEALRAKLRTIPGGRVTLPTARTVTIDPDDGSSVPLNVEHVMLVNDDIALFADLGEEKIAEILDFENSDGFYPSECWFCGSDWLAERQALLALIDIVLENF